MTAYKPWLVDMTEAQFRQWLAYQFEQASTGVAKTGVIAGLGVTATTPSPSGSVVVGKGAAICQPSSQAFPLIEPADETFDVFTANPMQFVNNPRNDVIVLDQVTGLVTNLVGTPNAVPSSGEQSVPATAVPLARLRHAANATTIPSTVIDDLRVFTSFSPEGAGWVTAAAAGFTAASGFSSLAGTVRLRGGVVNINFTIVSTNAIAAGNVGNINMINVPAAYQSGGGGAIQGGPFGPSWQGFTAGATLQLSSTTGAIAAGDTFSVVGTYLR
jgi:hypothetical protein